MVRRLDVPSLFLKEDRAIRTKRQQGGVAFITNGKSTSHIIEQGGDKRKIGRWRWIVVRGKEQKKTMIIGAFKTGASWRTTQNQVVALQNKENKEDRNFTDPTILWIEDLFNLIHTKQNEGCRIIL